MQKSYQPELVTLYGDDEQLTMQDVMDPLDYDMLMGGNLDNDDMIYLIDKYPELMGIWSKIIKGIGKVGKGIFKGIGRGVRRARKRRKRKKERAREMRKKKEITAALIEADRREAVRQLQMQQAAKKRQQQQFLTAAAIGTSLLFLLG